MIHEWISNNILYCKDVEENIIYFEKENWVNINKNIGLLDINNNIFDYELECFVLKENIQDNFNFDNIIDIYLEKFKYYKEYCFNTTEITILKFCKNNYYLEHIDFTNTTISPEYSPKYITIYICIDSNCVGGEFVINGMEIKMKKNDVIVFDSGGGTPYKINKIKEGEQILGVLWLI